MKKQTHMMRRDEPGWEQIGPLDKPKRRGLWLRASDGRVELCAGREGDDAHVELQATPEQIANLKEILERALSAWGLE